MGRVEELLGKLKRAARLFLSDKVPFRYKLIPLIALAYVIWPIDFITDYFPILGQLDDLAILIGSLGLFLKFCDEQV